MERWLKTTYQVITSGTEHWDHMNVHLRGTLLQSDPQNLYDGSNDAVRTARVWLDLQAT